MKVGDKYVQQIIILKASKYSYKADIAERKTLHNNQTCAVLYNLKFGTKFCTLDVLI